MQALKTVADSACDAAEFRPLDTLAQASAFTCSAQTLYAASEGGLWVYTIDNPQPGAPLGLSQRTHTADFPVKDGVAHDLALLSEGTVLMAKGCSRAQEPSTSAGIWFWTLKRDGTLLEKVREVALPSPFGGSVSTWAWHEDKHAYTVAVAFKDIHCTVQLLTFAKRHEGRAVNKPSSHTLHIAKDANGQSTVTNLHILRSDADRLRLFATVTQQSGPGRIETRSADLRHSGGEATTLEATAVAPGRSTDYASNEVIVASASELTGQPQSYFTQLSTFTAESRVTCLPYQHKITGALARIDTFTIAMPILNRRGEACVAVVDLKNRLELALHTIKQGVLKAVLPMRPARSLLLVHASGGTTLLSPKPLAVQVNNITKRKHYKEAIGVAEDALARLHATRAPERRAVQELIANTEAKFAAHLLERAGEPEAAMQHYIRTIGHLSVSTVIQKFLDTAHTELLKQYLEAVAATPAVMKPAYAAVLLALYVQLRDRDALRAFLDRSIDPGRGYRWEVDEAVATCLNGGYFEEARLVAKVSQRHAKTLDICLHHIGGDGGAAEALEYIRSLSRAQQEAMLQLYGKALISRFQLEMQVTPLVHTLCSPSPNADDPHMSNVGHFVALYDTAPGALRVLCDALLHEWLHTDADNAPLERGEQVRELRIIFHHLLELLLDPAHNTGPDGLSASARQAQALEALRSGWPAGAQEGPYYSTDLALQLCHFHAFEAGLLFLYERLQDYTRQQQVLVEFKDWEGLVKLGLERPGDHGQHLETVIAELVREHDAGDPTSGARGHIEHVLDAIIRDPALAELLAPLAVVGILARSEALTLDVAKRFVHDYVARQDGKARWIEQRIGELQAETAALQRQVEEKRTQPMWVSDAQGPEGARLGPAAVYFFCGHAYDEELCERRPDTGAFVCAKCQQDPGKQRIRRTAQADAVDRSQVNEQFFTEIRNRANAAVFDVIGHHLGNAGSLI